MPLCTQVGSQPVSAVSEMDLDHLKAVVEVAPLGHIAPPAPVVEPAEYGSTRPPLETCSPEEFLADLHLFYKVDDRFPQARFRTSLTSSHYIANPIHM